MYKIFFLIIMSAVLEAHEHVHFGVDPAENVTVHEHPQPAHTPSDGHVK